MCLSVKATSVLEALNSDQDEFVCYKFLVKTKVEEIFELRGPYYKKLLYKPGINESDSKRKVAFKKQWAEVTKGIHVFKKKKECRSSFQGEQGVIVQVTGKKADLLGASETEMVFSKVTLSEKEYNKHTKKKVKV